MKTPAPSQSRAARSATAWSTGCRLAGDLAITRRISAVAVSRARPSASRSRATASSRSACASLRCRSAWGSGPSAVIGLDPRRLGRNQPRPLPQPRTGETLSDAARHARRVTPQMTSGTACRCAPLLSLAPRRSSSLTVANRVRELPGSANLTRVTHVSRPETRPNPGWLLRDAQDLARENQVGVRDLVAVRFEQAGPLVCVAVLSQSDPRQGVTRRDRVLGEAMVRVDQGPTEGDWDDHLVQLVAQSGRGRLEDFESALGRRWHNTKRQGGVEVGHDRDLRQLRAVVVAHPRGDHAFEAGAHPADVDRIVDEVERPWLPHADRRKARHAATSPVVAR